MPYEGLQDREHSKWLHHPCCPPFWVVVPEWLLNALIRIPTELMLCMLLVVGPSNGPSQLNKLEGSHHSKILEFWRRVALYFLGMWLCVVILLATIWQHMHTFHC